MEFTQEDQEQIRHHGLSLSEAEAQVHCLNDAAHKVRVLRPAIPGDGIRVLSEERIAQLLDAYPQRIRGKKLLKFVPASGAATRMFKKWYGFLENLPGDALEGLKKDFARYPFRRQLSDALEKQGLSLESMEAEGKYRELLQFLLTSGGLDFGQLPKGLLPFHVYGEGVRTAFEEHWVEGAEYAAGSDGCIRLHFTVSPAHEEGFRRLAQQLEPKYASCTGLRYVLDFSCQQPQTDTVALDADGNLARHADGSLVFRPGGHGSLLHNLHALDADVVFVKNIDNVTVDALKADTYIYKKCLASLLIQLQQRCFALLETLDAGADASALAEIEDFLQQELLLVLPEAYARYSFAEKCACCRRLLDRPLRVCGMVRREKDPGGGPFWVENAAGDISLQIVETAEMDLDDAAQSALLDASQYFNPVDLVCGLKDYRGANFDLPAFVDRSRYFTAEKSLEGKPVRVLEHPGLWNGSMSDWNTLFVAVPLSTFTPVKTVEDLLRPAHSTPL